MKGDVNLANDSGVPSFIGNQFGDRSYEGLVKLIDAKYGSVEQFNKQFPNVSIQPAEGAHGGAGNRKSTLDAIEKGFKELSNRKEN
jgi:hypothetical protein